MNDLHSKRISACAILSLCLLLLGVTGCSNNDTPAGTGGTAGVAVTGTVAGPNGGIAKATPSSKSWFASLFEVAEAFAQQVTGWSAVPNATVRVFRIDNTGAPVGTTLIPPVTTAADGSFSLTLPTGTVLDSTLVAQVESDPAINGPVPVGTPNTYSTLLVQTTIALNPAVEAATRAIVNDPAPLTKLQQRGRDADLLWHLHSHGTEPIGRRCHCRHHQLWRSHHQCGECGRNWGQSMIAFADAQSGMNRSHEIAP